MDSNQIVIADQLMELVIIEWTATRVIAVAVVVVNLSRSLFDWTDNVIMVCEHGVD